jgi:hypothetical protein
MKCSWLLHDHLENSHEWHFLYSLLSQQFPFKNGKNTVAWLEIGATCLWLVGERDKNLFLIYLPQAKLFLASGADPAGPY